MPPTAPFRLAAGLMLLLSACSGVGSGGYQELPSAEPPEFTLSVGSTQSTTSRILAALLAVALEDRGVGVDDQIGVGDTEQNRDALLAGEIDVYPEDVSTGWRIHLGEREGVLDGSELGAEVARLDQRRNKIRWSGLSEFDASLGFAAKPRDDNAIERDGKLKAEIEEAEENGDPEDEDDPRPVAGADVLDANGWSFSALARLLSAEEDAMLCVTEAFMSSRDGLVRFETFTGFTVPNEQLKVFFTEDAGDAAEAETDRGIAGAIDGGECAAGTINRVSGQLAERGLVPIGPPSAGLFPPRNFGFSFSQVAFEEQERMMLDVTIGIFNSLDRSTMAELNARVEMNGRTPREVARQYLEEVGLVE